MEKTMSSRLDTAKGRIIEFGLFLIFLVLFGKFVFAEISPILKPLFVP
jgi:hypothetical protein